MTVTNDDRAVFETRRLPSGRVAYVDPSGKVTGFADLERTKVCSHGDPCLCADRPEDDPLPSFAELQERAVEQPVIAAGQKATGPSQKQCAFYQRLVEERFDVETTAELLIAFQAMVVRDASKEIDRVKALPRRRHASATKDLVAEGHLAKGAVHLVDGTYYRIHVGQGSGRPYAVEAQILETAIWHVDEDGVETLVRPGVVEWVLAKGKVFELSEATIAPPEQVKRFATLAGRCVFCSTKIDTPESTLVGYGPVCAGKFGLPWGATTSSTT